MSVAPITPTVAEDDMYELPETKIQVLNLMEQHCREVFGPINSIYWIELNYKSLYLKFYRRHTIVPDNLVVRFVREVIIDDENITFEMLHDEVQKLINVGQVETIPPPPIDLNEGKQHDVHDAGFISNIRQPTFNPITYFRTPRATRITQIIHATNVSNPNIPDNPYGERQEMNGRGLNISFRQGSYVNPKILRINKYGLVVKR